MCDFVHLHNHTHYSLLDAACTPEQLIKEAKKYDHKALALTDHGVMFGCLEFYYKAKKENIKPLIGFEAYVANGSRFDNTAGKQKTKRKNYFHLLLIAKNMTGYKNLLKLTTLGHTEGFYYKPRIDEELIAKYSEGVIACSGCLNGVINAYLVDGDFETAMKKAQFYQSVFGDDLYLELQNHNLPEDPVVLRDIPKIAENLNIKMVATNDVHYIKQEHAIAHNVYLHIKDASSSNAEKIDITQLRYRTAEMYFKSSDQMKDLFRDFPGAIEHTSEIADKCDLQFEEKIFLPNFPIPKTSKSVTLDDFLTELTWIGIRKRFSEITQEIEERLKYELQVILDMGFAGYFLIVQDFIDAAKRMGVRVGPGRGSAAGSLVAYALGITNVNPLPYDLLFERFLNPERVNMPDIDIDFCDDKREKVIEYVKQKYGENSVAQIVTFGKLSSRAVLKDVGRVLGISHNIINTITAKIPVIQGKVTPLNDAIKMHDLKWVVESEDKDMKQLIEYSTLLEGFFRNTSTHAAGVVITPGDVVDYVPLYQSPGSKSQGVDIATQYGMKDLETAGLLKMDFLGLRTLSIIDNTLEMIKNNHGIDIDIDTIDFNDDKTYDIFSNGQTLGIFQFESDGMKEFLKQLKPKDLEEITAMNALYRPGPMENIPEFIERKFGRKSIEYLHPKMENSLSKTYGVIVYQEQVMQLARDIGGFTLGQSDIIRRAMGKKDAKMMAEQKAKFVEGAMKNDFTKKIAEEIFDLIEKFAAYGFNKSHSLAYSILAYQTAWLKAHYPAEFIAANMTAELNNQSKIVDFMLEATSLNIKVLPPDVNNSTSKFNTVDNTIYFSLAGVKNVGSGAALSIMNERIKNGSFASMFDFVSRLDSRIANKRILEALICAGAFDSTNTGTRATLFNGVETAMDYAKSSNKSTNDMDSLFMGSSEAEVVKEPKLKEHTEWDERYKLSKEKEYLGFYVSGNPLQRYRGLIEALSTIKFDNPDSKLIGEQVRVCGIITEIQTRLDKKGNTFAFVKIEDLTAKAELIFWSDSYGRNGHHIKEDSIVVCLGKAESDGETIKIIVDKIMPLGDGIIEYSRGFNITLDSHLHQESDLQEFLKLCDDPSAKTLINFYVEDKILNSRRKLIAEEVNLPINETTINKILDIFGKNNVKLITSL